VFLREFSKARPKIKKKKAMAQKDKNNEEPIQLADLTLQAQTILARLAKDKANSEIDLYLSISVSTAKVADSAMLRETKKNSAQEPGLHQGYAIRACLKARALGQISSGWLVII
jgi:DNA-binding NarL/FixJ family response regulator